MAKGTRLTHKNVSAKNETIFLLDGDNHFDEGKKGIEKTRSSEKVVACFSQPGAKRKFDKTYGKQQNVSSRLVPPGEQAVDNLIKTYAGNYSKNGKRVVMVSQDKDFAEYRDRKKQTQPNCHISVARSVEKGSGKNTGRKKK